MSVARQDAWEICSGQFIIRGASDTNHGSSAPMCAFPLSQKQDPKSSGRPAVDIPAYGDGDHHLQKLEYDVCFSIRSAAANQQLTDEATTWIESLQKKCIMWNALFRNFP